MLWKPSRVQKADAGGLATLGNHFRNPPTRVSYYERYRSIQSDRQNSTFVLNSHLDCGRNRMHLLKRIASGMKTQFVTHAWDRLCLPQSAACRPTDLKSAQCVLDRHAGYAPRVGSLRTPPFILQRSAQKRLQSKHFLVVRRPPPRLNG
jgi:hypothetical protein